MSNVSDRLQLHHRSPGAAIGTVGGFLLIRCFGTTSPDDIRATLKGHQAAVACRPHGIGSVVVVEASSAFPSEETRRVSVETMRDTNDRVAANVLILLGDGFWASALRGVITTMNSLSAAAYPKKVVRHEAEGVRWITESLGESVEKYEPVLLAALAQLKQ
jgi:hypothetical protein